MAHQIPQSIRLAEPWGGGHYALDTGLCNRLLHWELVYGMVKHTPTDHQIVCLDQHWYELDFVTLPETQLIGYYEGRLKSAKEPFHSQMYYDIAKFNYIFDIEDFSMSLPYKITDEMVKKMHETGNYKLPKEDHFITDFDWHLTDCFTEDIAELNLHDKYFEDWGLSEIKFTDPAIDEYVKNFASKFIGIHLRRGAGVKKTQEQIDSTDPNTRRFFAETEADKYISSVYRFYSNEEIFKFIDRALQIDPNQKFYVSTDLPPSSLTFLKQRYGRKIYSREDLVAKMPSHLFYSLDLDFYKHDIEMLDDYYIPSDKTVYTNTLLRRVAFFNMVDLITLGHCMLLLTPSFSTWSYVAKKLANRPSISLDANFQDFEYLYMSAKHGTYTPPPKYKQKDVM